MTARLVTIPASHYCEKARWALDRTGVDYVEEGHLPLFSAVPAKRLGGRRTVPVLDAGGEVVPDSTDILHWCDARGAALFPSDLPDAAALEDDFDRHLGPATRRLAYFHLLQSRAALAEVMRKNVPRWEQRAARLTRPLAVLVIRKRLQVDAAGAERSRAVIDRTFAQVAARLGDGRRYLCGDRFTAADLTFAALSAPILLPDAYAPFGVSADAVPPAMRAVIDEYRAHPAGAFALRVYAQDRNAAGAPTRQS